MSEEKVDERPFGVEDASFQAAGGYDGIHALVEDFYDRMEVAPEAEHIRRMHKRDLTEARDKLTRFLCGWLGGPKLYSQKYGPIAIPPAHVHLKVGEDERDAWLSCMEWAAERQPYSPAFKSYLLEQLFVPAERIRQVSTRAHGLDEKGA